MEKSNKTTTLSKALLRSEQFISFRSFTEGYLTDNAGCQSQLAPYLRERTPGAGRKFLENLSNRIAFEAWRRAQRQSGTNDDIILNAEEICFDLDSFIRKFHF